MITPLAFLGRTIVLMIPAFLIWAVLAQLLAGIPVWLNDWLLPQLFSDAVRAVRLQGSEAMFISAFGELNGSLVPPGQSEDALAVLVDTRIVSYSIPFFCALHFALGGQRALGFWVSLVVLIGLMTLGVGALGIMSLWRTIGAADPTLVRWVLPEAEAIALAYQFSTLIVPSIAPVLCWAAVHRHHPLFEGFSARFVQR